MKRAKVFLVQAREVVLAVEGIGDIYDRGYHWVRGTFQPAVLRLCVSSKRIDRQLASFGHYVLGDVHDFNHTPRAAIRAYKNCLALDPSDAAAWREIGTCYQEMGNAWLGYKAFRRALALDPQDEHAQSELRLLEEIGACSVYADGDRAWQSAEYLARGRFKSALESLGRSRSTRIRLQRARIFGAMGDDRAVLREWQKIDTEL